MLWGRSRQRRTRGAIEPLRSDRACSEKDRGSNRKSCQQSSHKPSIQARTFPITELTYIARIGRKPGQALGQRFWTASKQAASPPGTRREKTADRLKPVTQEEHGLNEVCLPNLHFFARREDFVGAGPINNRRQPSCGTMRNNKAPCLRRRRAVLRVLPFFVPRSSLAGQKNNGLPHGWPANKPRRPEDTPLKHEPREMKACRC